MATQEAKLRKWVQSAFAPCIYAVTTDDVEDACQKNGLSFVQLLEPFATLRGIEVPIRTPSTSHSLQNFRFRFQHASQVQPDTQEVVAARLKQSIEAAPPLENLAQTLRKAPRDKQDISAYTRHLARDSSGDSMPWCSAFRDCCIQSLAHQQFHMLDHPTASLIVVSTKHENPLACFEQLCNPQYLPPSFVNGQYSPGSVSKFYVLVHDEGVGAAPNVDPEAILARLRKNREPDQCYLLRINSLKPESYNTTAPSALGTTPPQFNNSSVAVVGQALSERDLECLSTVTHGIVKKGIDLVERRIHQIHGQVKATRQGLRNTFKHMWRKPAKTTRPAEPLAQQYTYDSTESQIRVLADLAFMVHDYELALSMYRLVRDDYKSDKTYIHLANTKMMMGLTAFMLGPGPSKRNILSYFEGAFQDYCEAARELRRPPTSAISPNIADNGASIAATLMFYCLRSTPTALRSTPRTLAAMMLTASTDESNLAAACLLEMAGTCLIGQDWVAFETQTSFTFNPFVRKFALHMIMAGWLYHECGLVAHAARCYATVVQVYEQSNWLRVENHLHDHLGKWAAQLGEPVLALNAWASQLGNAQQGPEEQTCIIDQFRTVLGHWKQSQRDDDPQTHPKSLELTVPYIDHQSIVVCQQHNASILPPASTLPQSPGIDADDVLWKTMQDDIESAMRTADEKPKISKYIPPIRQGSAPKPRTCHVDEPLFVYISLQNPLQVPLELRDVSLKGQVLDSNTKELLPQTALDVEKVEMIRLNPNEKRVVRLSFTPRQVGMVHVVAVEWMWLDVLPVTREFKIRGPKLYATRSQRANGERAADVRLHANAMSPAPWLGAELSHVPRQMVQGQLYRTTLELINLSNVPMETDSLYVCCSCPGIVITTHEYEDDTQTIETYGDLGRVFQLKSSHELEMQGNLVEYPVWIRLDESCTAPRPVVFHLLFHYRGLKQHGGLPRFLRYSKTVELLPALSLNHMCGVVTAGCGTFSLDLVLKNDVSTTAGRMENSSIVIHKIQATSRQWKLDCSLSSLSEFATIPFGSSMSIPLYLSPVVPDPDTKHITTSVVRLVEETASSTRNEMVSMNFLCQENAALVHRDRDEARILYEQKRAQLEAQGQLPVSIQDVRRAATESGANGSLSGESLLASLDNGTPRPGEPRAASMEALLWHNRENYVHISVDWSVKVGESYIPGTSYALRVDPSPSENHGPIQIRPVYSSTLVSNLPCQLPVELQVVNVGSSTPLSCTIHLNDHWNQPSSRYPFHWLGRTTKHFTKLSRGQIERFQATCYFTRAGVFDINTILIQVQDKPEVYKPIASMLVHVHRESHSMNSGANSSTSQLPSMLEQPGSGDAFSTGITAFRDDVQVGSVTQSVPQTESAVFDAQSVPQTDSAVFDEVDEPTAQAFQPDEQMDRFEQPSEQLVQPELPEEQLDPQFDQNAEQFGQPELPVQELDQQFDQTSEQFGQPGLPVEELDQPGLPVEQLDQQFDQGSENLVQSEVPAEQLDQTSEQTSEQLDQPGLPNLATETHVALVQDDIHEFHNRGVSFSSQGDADAVHLFANHKPIPTEVATTNTQGVKIPAGKVSPLPFEDNEAASPANSNLETPENETPVAFAASPPTSDHDNEKQSLDTSESSQVVGAAPTEDNTHNVSVTEASVPPTPTKVANHEESIKELLKSADGDDDHSDIDDEELENILNDHDGNEDVDDALSDDSFLAELDNM